MERLTQTQQDQIWKGRKLAQVVDNLNKLNPNLLEYLFGRGTDWDAIDAKAASNMEILFDGQEGEVEQDS